MSIYLILLPTRQHLEGEEVAQSGNGQVDPRENLHGLRGRYDLRLDPGRGEEKIDTDRERCGTGGDETEARKSTDIDLFQVSPYRLVAISQASNRPHHAVSFLIARHDHGDIHIVGGSGFRSR
jgi:hypothetical protein